jgi:hypothetical protein
MAGETRPDERDADVRVRDGDDPRRDRERDRRTVVRQVGVALGAGDDCARADLAGGETPRVIRTDSPAATVPIEQRSEAQAPRALSAERSESPAGISAWTATPVAFDGPRFVAVRV